MQVSEELQAEAAQCEGESARVQDWGRNMPYMYKLSEGLVKEELSAIIAEAGGNRVDPDRLSEDKRTLLLMYVSSLENWQEVGVPGFINPLNSGTPLRIYNSAPNNPSNYTKLQW